VRVKTSVTLPDDLLRQIDRTQPNRSSFIEKAARKYLEDEARTKRRMKDAAILERLADKLNEEAADVLEYQGIPE
jgi:metal-responsive CopG/Arc/MetJ family transcriptional regulator